MAHLLKPRGLSSSIFRLPPAIRSAAFQSRAFSSTPSRKLALLDVAVAGPNAVIDSIHSLGIPWYATLPLTAVLVRGTFVYYFASLPRRKRDQKRVLLLPLTSARSDTIAATKLFNEEREWRIQNMPIFLQVLARVIKDARARFMAMHEIGKPFGTPLFSPRSFLNFGMLIMFTEAIRLKCGAREGLLSLLLGPFQWLVQTIDPERFPTPAEPEVRDIAEIIAERAEAAQRQAESTADAQVQSAPEASHASGILDGQDVESMVQSGTATALEPLGGMGMQTAYFDPSMMTEGLAWFTDLTVADNTFILPAMLSTALLANFLLRPAVANALTSINQDTKGNSSDRKANYQATVQEGDSLDNLAHQVTSLTRGQRFGVFLSIAFFFFGLNMPAAILLYFIPSISIGWLQSRWLDFKYPLPQPVQKCARRMRLKPKRQWRNS